MKGIVISYFLLLALLTLTILAYYEHWPLQSTIGLSIAAAKVLVIVWIFMSLRTSTGLSKLAATAGILWLVFFYVLAAFDIFFRPIMPGSTWR